MTVPPSMCAPFLDAARVVLDLVDDDAVGAAWDRPSALEHLTVGALACHLAGQLASTEATLDHGVDAAGPVPVREHYTKVAWRGASLEEETNRAIRESASTNSALGSAALRSSAHEAFDRLITRLPQLDGDTLVQPPWTTWSLRLDDFLMTRLVELTVHLDDLAVSLHVEPSPLPESVQQPVRHLLVDLAAQRHGEVAVLRALTRSERAPRTISAF